MRMVCDVTYWMNQILYDLKANAIALNTAIEATSLGPVRPIQNPQRWTNKAIRVYLRPRPIHPWLDWHSQARPSQTSSKKLVGWRPLLLGARSYVLVGRL